jgi:haloacetate dehalogenase
MGCNIPNRHNSLFKEKGGGRMKTRLSRRSLLGSAMVLGAAQSLGQAQKVFAQETPDLDARLFPGFRVSKIDTEGASIHTLVGGEGPPILLLHGAPQSHFSWAEVANSLARDYTVVLTDLRGYGYSSKPDGGENHINYSKRTMARDQVQVMDSLGYDRFVLFGHDRGGRVARRLTLDNPDRVEKLAVLDIVPAHYLYDHTTREFAEAYIHWFMFIRPAPFAENIIASTGMFAGGGPGETGEEYRRIYQDPAAVHAMCEDYRASANMDMDIDKMDLAAGKTIDCPLNVLWGDAASMGKLYDVLGIWQQEATRAQGKAMPGGHSFHTQNPRQTYDELVRFLRA